VNENKPHS